MNEQELQTPNVSSASEIRPGMEALKKNFEKKTIVDFEACYHSMTDDYTKYQAVNPKNAKLLFLKQLGEFEELLLRYRKAPEKAEFTESDKIQVLDENIKHLRKILSANKETASVDNKKQILAIMIKTPQMAVFIDEEYLKDNGFFKDLIWGNPTISKYLPKKYETQIEKIVQISRHAGHLYNKSLGDIKKDPEVFSRLLDKTNPDTIIGYYKYILTREKETYTEDPQLTSILHECLLKDPKKYPIFAQLKNKPWFNKELPFPTIETLLGIQQDRKMEPFLKMVTALEKGDDRWAKDIFEREFQWTIHVAGIFRRLPKELNLEKTFITENEKVISSIEKKIGVSEKDSLEYFMKNNIEARSIIENKLLNISEKDFLPLFLFLREIEGQFIKGDKTSWKKSITNLTTIDKVSLVRFVAAIPNIIQIKEGKGKNEHGELYTDIFGILSESIDVTEEKKIIESGKGKDGFDIIKKTFPIEKKKLSTRKI